MTVRPACRVCVATTHTRTAAVSSQQLEAESVLPTQKDGTNSTQVKGRRCVPEEEMLSLPGQVYAASAQSSGALSMECPAGLG